MNIIFDLYDILFSFLIAGIAVKVLWTTFVIFELLLKILIELIRRSINYYTQMYNYYILEKKKND